MADSNRRVAGNPKQGNIEMIYPEIIWRGDLPKNPLTIRFDSIVHDTSQRVMKNIKEHGGFKGGIKKYDENKYATFSWWTVCLDDNGLKTIQDGRKMEQELEQTLSEKNVSRYGTRRFVERFNAMFQRYEDCLNSTNEEKRAEIRILGTYSYTREVMHALVIAPVDDQRFVACPLVAKNLEGDAWGEWIANDLIRDIGDGTYEWNEFSAISWDNSAHPPKQRYWGHLAFAFCLNPLPDMTLRLPQEILNKESKWERCKKAVLYLGDPNDDENVKEEKYEETDNEEREGEGWREDIQCGKGRGGGDSSEESELEKVQNIDDLLIQERAEDTGCIKINDSS